MIVYQGGSYDLIHPGHLYTLRQCRVLAGPTGEVVVSLNTDEFIAEFKHHPPVQDYLARSEVLSAIRYVDRVIPNVGGADSKPAIDAVGPDIIAVGADWWSFDDQLYCHQMGFDHEWLDRRGINLVYLKALAGVSSTILRATAREMSL
jgi:glycerol-3-phosphate cytidylyltransferase